MDPVTLGVMSLGTGLAGSAISAGGAMAAGEATKSQRLYQAAVANNNRIIAERNAETAIDAGQTRAAAELMKGGATQGSIMANQGASGLDVNVGTPLAVRQSAAELSNLDALTLVHNAAREAAGYKNQAAGLTAESTLDVMAGKNAAQAGEINAMSSILGGASSFSDKWMGMSRRGVFAGLGS